MENHFEELPLEILSKIFSYFDSEFELKGLSLVCKKWFEAIEFDAAFSQKFTLSYARINKLCAIPQFYKNYVNLEATKDKNDPKCFEKIKKIISTLKLNHLELKSFNTNEIVEILRLTKTTLKSLVIVIDYETINLVEEAGATQIIIKFKQPL